MRVYTLFLLLSICSVTQGQNKKDNLTETKTSWDKAYNKKTKTRFIPVELFTGRKWDGKHELILKEATTTSCVSVKGRRKNACDEIQISGPFKTAKNNTKIKWVGNQIPYYKRAMTLRSGPVVSYFTINNTKDGLVRIYDKRKKWGTRTYDGLGSKFPLGYWKQGEVRVYPSRRPTRIEIIELDGPNHCLTFRWTVGEGKGRNSDNIYTFCPDKGFTKFRYYNEGSIQKKGKSQN